MFLANLILLGIQGYDVILRTDWLAKYRATIDCKQKALVSSGESNENPVFIHICDSNAYIDFEDETF